MDNATIVKYLLLALTAPIWLPVLKALWVEVDRMLLEDGGVFGRPPSAKEVEELRAERAGRPDPLVNEPLARESAPRAGGAAAAAGGAPRRTGFR